MNDPTFRLEGVVKIKNELEDFEGPLTLILQLLSKNKIEIRDIRISDIVDQYMAYLEEMERMDLEIASEFVSMASHLLYIKAKSLLVAEQEISELEELMASLEKLKNKEALARIRSVAEELVPLWEKGRDSFQKPQETIEPDREYRYEHQPRQLLEALASMADRLKASELITLVPMPERIEYSVTDKTDEIIQRLRGGRVSLGTLFREAKSRSELVAVFVSVLELYRECRIALDDDGMISTYAEEGNGA